jgi:prophage antirepressor-like protein
MSNHLPIVAEFEGKPVTVFAWNDRHVWIAREVGAAIGYSGEGKRLVSQITGEWASEFIPGHDYEILEGAALSDFKRSSAGDAVAAKTNRELVVLYESGLHLALTKTDKPAGRALRRYLVDEVLPQIARTGTFQDPQLLLFPDKPDARGPVTLAERREECLAFREHRLAGRLDLDERKFKVATLHRTAEILRNLGRIDADQYALLEVSACEIALGFPLIHLYPPPVRDAVATALGLVPADLDAADEVTEEFAEAA